MSPIEVAEARRRRGARRAPCRSARSRCARGGSSSAGGSPTRRSSSASSSASPSGADGMRRVRHLGERGVALGLGGGELLLGRAERLLDAPGAPRAAPASACPSASSRPRSSSTRGTSARQRSSAASRRSNASAGALARERGPPGVGIAAGCLEVDHARESRAASITAATPSSSGPAQVASAICEQRVSRRPRSANPKPAASSSSMSFSPSPKATIRSSSSPRRSATKVEPRCPSRRPGGRSRAGRAASGVRKSRSPNSLRRASPVSSGSSLGLRRRRRASSAERRARLSRSPTSVTGRCWKSAYAREYSVCSATKSSSST